MQLNNSDWQRLKTVRRCKRVVVLDSTQLAQWHSLLIVHQNELTYLKFGFQVESTAGIQSSPYEKLKDGSTFKTLEAS